MIKKIFAGVLFVVCFALFSVSAYACPPDDPDCPDVNPITAGGEILNQIFRSTGDDSNGSFAGGSGKLTLNSSGTNLAEISGRIDSTVKTGESVTDNSANIQSDVIFDLSGWTKQEDCGKGNIEADAVIEQGTWMNLSQPTGYAYGGEQVRVEFGAEKSTNGPSLNLNALLNASGYTNGSIISEPNHARSEVSTSGTGSFSYGGTPCYSNVNAENAFGGGVVLGSSSAEFWGSGNVTGRNSAIISGKGFSDIKYKSIGNTETINAVSYAKEKGSGK